MSGSVEAAQSLIPPPAPGQNALGWEAGAGKNRARFSGLGLYGLHGLGLELAQAGQGMFLGSPQASCGGWDFEGSYVPTLKTYVPLCYSLCGMGTRTLGDKLLCFSVSSSPACPPHSQHCARRTQMCVFPTAALHPRFYPGHGGHRAARVGREVPPPSSASPMNVPGSSLSVWETEARNRQSAVKSGWARLLSIHGPRKAGC